MSVPRRPLPCLCAPRFLRSVSAALILLCALFAPLHTGAATFVITSEADLHTYAPLARSGDTLLFTPGLTVNLGSGVSVGWPADFALDGQGGSITGNNSFRLLNTNTLGGISNLTLQGGNAGQGTAGPCL